MRFFAEQAALAKGESLPLEHVLARHKNAKRKWWRRKAANDYRKAEWEIVCSWHIFNFAREEEAAKVASAEAEQAVPVAALMERQDQKKKTKAF